MGERSGRARRGFTVAESEARKFTNFTSLGSAQATVPYSDCYIIAIIGGSYIVVNE